MAVPRVFVVVGDEVQLALPDAGQGAVGAAQQERAHVRPGQATAMFNYLLFLLSVSDVISALKKGWALTYAQFQRTVYSLHPRMKKIDSENSLERYAI